MINRRDINFKKVLLVSTFCFLTFLSQEFVSQTEDDINELIKLAENTSLPAKTRVDYYINVSENIDENLMEPYCLKGLALLKSVDSVKYPYQDYLNHKAALLVDLAYYTKAKGNLKKAFSIYFDAFVYAEKSKSPVLIGDINNNIGMLYYSQHQYPEALTRLRAAIKSYNPESDSSLIGRTLINVAGAYGGLKNYKESISTYKSSIKFFENLKDTNYLAYCYNNISVSYQYIKQFDSASYYNKKALSLFVPSGNEDNIAWAYDVGASIYWEFHLLDSTIKYCRKCIDIAVRRNLPDQFRSCSYNMYLAKQAKGLYKDALRFYITADSIQDSLINAGNRVELVKSQMQFDYNKKEEQFRTEAAINNVKHEEENLRTKVVLGFVSGFFIVLCVFAYFIFKNYRKEKLSKETITVQKAVIEEKQKEIIDSIKYAKRIQISLLASDKYIEKNINRLKPGKKEGKS